MPQALTEKQARFLEEIVKDMLVDAAGRRAKISENYAKRLMGKKWFLDLVNKKIKAQNVYAEPTQERILQELMAIAFFDPAKLFDDRGNPLPLSKIDENTRRCIAGIEFSVEGKGDDAEVIKKYKIIDKHKALENLGRYLAMFTDKMKLDVPTELEKMSDDQLRSTAIALAEAAGLTIGPADFAETQH